MSKRNFWDFAEKLVKYGFFTVLLVGIPKVIVIKKKKEEEK
jgi:hypothetical protein